MFRILREDTPASYDIVLVILVISIILCIDAYIKGRK